MKNRVRVSSLIRAMNEELDQIEKNNTWELVSRPEDKNVDSFSNL